jgi:hypothetical protein
MECKMQNANYFGMIKYKIPKFSWVQNAKIFMGWVRTFCLFGFFWPLETKIQNGEWILFCQKFCMVFSFILQNDEPKPKKFWVK